MFILVALYMALLGLLVLGAALFFVKALQFRQSSVKSSAPSLDFTDREEIVARLERQFHSSPSSDI